LPKVTEHSKTVLNYSSANQKVKHKGRVTNVPKKYDTNVCAGDV